MIRIIIFTLIFLFSSDYIYSQFYFFGRNKVQYEKFDWKVIRTDHFDIYYYNETEEIAEIGAAYAEEAYAELKVKFNHLVSRKIPLIFYNTSIHFQQTNTTPGFIPEGVGGFFEFIKGRVVIPYMGSLKDFRHVIRHELVHVFMTTKVFRVLSDHRLPADVLPPLWFVEGMAEFYSTDVDAQAEMVMRDAVINNYFVGLTEMYRIYGSFLMYKEGQSFLEYIKEKYGEDKVMHLIENMWMYNNNFEKIIEYTIGKKIEDIDSEWSYYLKQKYYPLLEIRSPQEVSSRKLTKEGFNFSPVYYNNYIYFNANRDGYSSLYRMKITDRNNTDEEEPELLIRGERTEEFEAFHLFQSAIDISDDGLLVFVTKSGATDAVHFYSIKDNEVIKTFQEEFLISISSPKFSTDGKRIVFNAVDQKGFSDLFILDIREDRLTRLTDDYYDDRDPSFGKNDSTIIFSSDRSDGEFAMVYNIFSYNIISSRIEYITFLGANCYSPVMNRQGNKLLFTSDYDGVHNIWMLESDGDEFSDTVRQVTGFTTSAFNPVFVNEDEIAFTGFENFSFNLYNYKIKSDTAEQITALRMNYDSTGSSWHPDKIYASAEKEKFKYEKEYTLDYAQSQVSTDPVFGTRGGAIFSLSDLFGDDNYFFLLYNTADVQSDFLKSFNIVIQRLNLSERANYGYGVFHFSGRRYDIRESEEYFFERSYGGFFQMHFPLSKFQRLEAGVSIANSDKQIITGFLERKALLFSNTLAYVHDNSLWGPSGPLDGIRALLLLGYTGDVKFSNVNYFTVIADYRHYLRIGFRSAIALRTALFYNEGKEARRYFMGGSWDLRGWPRWSVRGEKMWLSSLELRFPLLDLIQLQFPFINLGFFGIRGAAFFDAGSAWDEDYKTTLGSVGAGVRFNLFGALVLRYDMGKKIEKNFSAFQNGLFYQFFFGWDF